MNLLLVEDDATIRELVRHLLQIEGFTVDSASSCADAREKIGVGEYDAFILDVLLPDGTGYDLLSEMRKSGILLPVLMLTSLDASEDVIQGLDAGADDYLTKPFQPGVLAARVRALVRRGVSKAPPSQINIGDVEVDRLSRLVTVAGRKVRLTPKEYMFLEHLALNPGRVVSRMELLERVWGLTFDPGSNVVDAHLARLRGKLQKAGAGDLIVTIRGGGFQIANGEDGHSGATRS
jgi:two-component system OmpR family response regulator